MPFKGIPLCGMIGLGDQWATAGQLDELSFLFIPKLPAPSPQILNATPISSHPDQTIPVMPNASPPAVSRSKKYRWHFVLAACIVAGAIIWAVTITQGIDAKEGNDERGYTQENTPNLSATEAANKQMLAEIAEKRRKDSLLGIKNEQLRNNWNNQLYLKVEDLGTGTSGYQEFDVKVVNNLENIMDEVIVNVKLLDNYGNLLEEKNITFRNIQPSDSKKQTYPIEVAGAERRTVVISRITSRSLHFCYNRDYDTPEGRRRSGERDPWFCK